MSTIILAINAGSSSLKISVFSASASAENPKELAVAQIDGLSSSAPTLKYNRGEENVKGKKLQDVKGHDDAFRYVLEHIIQDGGLSDIKSKKDIKYACHRIVHGGDYGKVQVINKDTFHHLEELSDLAPLHNATGLALVRITHNELPETENLAYFDSQFHKSIPEHIRTYAIDPKVANKNKLRKYGFHGISYAFITQAVAKHLSKSMDELNIIALHLGSGASACCIRGGKSYDTSMGLTPVSGLPGGTRSGDVDPSLVFHYTHDAGKPSPKSTKDLHISTAEEILNKQSGFKAMAGTSDFGKISASDDPACKLVYDLFIDRILNFVGAYYVKLGGQVDAIVFAGGIGEKGVQLRKTLIEQCACFGFKLDDAKNDEPEDVVVADIGAKDARHKALICQTDEQLEMARGCIAEASSNHSKP